jgi:putative RNA 2'-phosphotransferase
MKNIADYTKLSKFLSLVLRHNPGLIGIQLNEQGWTDVETLLRKMNEFGKNIDIGTLNKVVEIDNKKRYAYNSDKTKIRASQGHSVKIDLGYSPETPPEFLYHGTASKFVDSILKSGIQKRGRHHVHLSPDIATAVNVGKRHGNPVVFEIKANEMFVQGFVFFISENGVWLTCEVPAIFLQIVDHQMG